MLLHGEKASFLGRVSGDVTVPPPGRGLAETLAIERGLNSLEQVCDLLSGCSRGSALGLGGLQGSFLSSRTLIGADSGFFDTCSLLGFSVGLLGHASFEVGNISVEEESSVGSLVFCVGVVVGIERLFPSIDFSLHRFAVGLQAFGRDFFAWAWFSAHSGGGSNGD